MNGRLAWGTLRQLRRQRLALALKYPRRSETSMAVGDCDLVISIVKGACIFFLLNNNLLLSVTM